MSPRGLVKVLCATVILATAATPSAAEPAPPESQRAKEVQALVEKAAALIDQQGRSAFAEFRRPNSEWFHGDTYLFSYDMKGNVLLNPAVPKREGTNPAAQGEKDKTGKPFHDAILETAKLKGSGWVDYWLPKPGQTEPSHKWTYVKRVTLDGVPALIGAGFYDS
jgi:signal transduction histidine kinase